MEIYTYTENNYINNDDHDKTTVESMGKTEYKAIYLPETKLLFDKNILLHEHSRAIHIK